MRILLLSMYYAPDPAANAVIMTGLVDQLVDLGHEVTVIAAYPHYDRNAIWPEYRGRLWRRARDGAVDAFRTYLYVPRRKTSLLGRLLNYVSYNALALLIGLTRRNHDVILVPSPPLTLGFIGFLLSRWHRIPFVYNVQDIYPDIAIRVGVLTNERLIRFFYRLESFVYRTAAAVTVLSEGFRRNLLSKRVPPAKVHIIPNFVDCAFMRPLPRRNAWSAAHALDDAFVVMYAGNVGLSQGLETVLAAADRLRDRADIRFLIVGNGAAKADLAAAAEARRLDNVTFLPFQPRADLPEMYASADASLVVLRRGIGSESVPSKAYTIMASGRPMIAAVDAATETHHLIEETACGLWVPAEDDAALAAAIERLAAERRLGRRMGAAGRAYVEAHHTPAAVGRAYAALLARINRSQSDSEPIHA